MKITKEFLNTVVGHVVATLQTNSSPEKNTAAIRREKLGLLTREEFAEATGRTVRSLKRDAIRRVGPKPVRMGQKIFYRITDIERYLEKASR